MQVKINRRSAYAPIRYEATRPFAVNLGKAFSAASARGEASRHSFLMDTLLPVLKRQIGAGAGGGGPVQSEIANVQVFGNYMAGGKIILDMAKVLCQALLHTDAADVPCGELVFPFKSFYIHFGGDAGLHDSGMAIEGVFVHKEGDRVLFELAPGGFGSVGYLSLPAGEFMVGGFLLLGDPKKTVSQALHDSINGIVEGNKAMLEQIAVLEKQLSQQYGQVIRVPTGIDDLQGKEPLLLKVLNLVINTLFYINAEPDDVQEDWGRETPKEALEELRKTDKAGTIKTLENSLLKAGYTKVRIVGRRYGESIAGQAVGEAISSGRTMPTHFRRGHLRHQAHGPEHALRKWIFVAPVVVNLSAGQDLPGRIYDVAPPRTSSGDEQQTGIP